MLEKLDNFVLLKCTKRYFNKQKMTYHLLRFFFKLMSRLPFCVLYVMSGGLYLLLYHVVRYRRGIVRKNLTESFPEKTPAEIRDIEKKSYRFFADNIAESFKLSAMSPEEMGRRMRFTNVEAVNSVLRQGRSIALYLGHYGNWEWISSMPLHLEKSAVPAQIYHKLRNKNMNRIILEHRASHGAVNVDMYKTARYITEMAAKGQTSVIGFIADQSPKKREVRHFLQFLHHRTPVLTGTEKITKHYGFEAWFLRVNRVSRGYYEAEFIQMHENPKSLPDFELTRIYYELLEKAIREKPELYLWTHNRFKHAELSEPGGNL